MRKAIWAALAIVACAAPWAAAQRGEVRNERRVARLMDRLREEMWSYRQELNFFQRYPEYPHLVDLRYELRGLAIQVGEADDRDPQAQRLARELDRAARELYHETDQLEHRAFSSPSPEPRRRAEALEERAVEIRVLVGRLYEVVRIEPDSRPYDRR